MKKIGIIGEDPNDTTSIQNLLVKKYPKLFHCKPMIRNKKGYQLDNERVPKSLKVEFEDYNPDIVIFVRDVDGLATEQVKIKKVKDWFEKLNAVVDKKGILLHNIYELEAMILADIDTFNRMYNTQIKFPGNVMFQKEPKEYLIGKTEKLQKTYAESHCPDIFNNLNFDTVVKRCDYFRAFNEAFIQKLK